MTDGPADEFATIARFFAPLAAGEPGAFGLLDDAAALGLPDGSDLVVTADTLVEGVHFFATDPPLTVGAKVLGVNLSDLAAMGARPRAYLVGIAIPAGWEPAWRNDWVGGFAEGLAETQAAYGIALVGGDTVATPGPLVVTVTALGSVASGRALRRAGARPGDRLYVSGTIGDGALGLRMLKGGLGGLNEAEVAHLIDRYRRPRPRVGLGQALVGIAHAAVDISDGLVADVAHICRASGVNARINSAAVPLSPAARVLVGDDPSLLSVVLTGGDDYELAFTVAKDAERAIARLAEETGLALTVIGEIEAADGDRVGQVRVVDPSGRPLTVASGGYRHF